MSPQVMHQSEPDNGYPLLHWGGLLLRPEISRHHEGCVTLESAAITYARAMDGPAAARAVDVCLATLRDLNQQQQQGPSTGGRTIADLQAEPAAAAVAMSPSGKTHTWAPLAKPYLLHLHPHRPRLLTMRASPFAARHILCKDQPAPPLKNHPVQKKTHFPIRGQGSAVLCLCSPSRVHRPRQPRSPLQDCQAGLVRLHRLPATIRHGAVSGRRQPDGTRQAHKPPAPAASDPVIGRRGPLVAGVAPGHC